jgi:hypothetical protein
MGRSVFLTFVGTAGFADFIVSEKRIKLKRIKVRC